MADTEQEFKLGIVDIRRNNKGQQVTSLGTQGTTVNYNNVPNLRSRLAAANAGYYTTARLNAMTKNDMIYAIRQSDDAAGIR